MDQREHWDRVYATSAPTDLSWYQDTPTLALDLIERAGLGPSTEIIDIGGGDATLVDCLLARGAGHITVLDISAVAVARAQARLGSRAKAVTWIEADVTQAVLPTRRFDIWHDRAVFHFLTDARDQAHYLDLARGTLKRGGHLIVATFATDAPRQCSGFDVARYTPDALRSTFSSGFDLVTHGATIHQTPTGTEQPFTYCCLRRQ
jgi:ubiquinone/menaquinone biosynthesis C-methylase UbiE